MRVGDLVDVNQTRGSGSYKHITALGVGVILDVEETDDINFEPVGLINLGELFTVLLNNGQTKVFCKKSLKLL